MGGDHTTRKGPGRNGRGVRTSCRTRLTEINRRGHRGGIGDLGRRSPPNGCANRTLHATARRKKSDPNAAHRQSAAWTERESRLPGSPAQIARSGGAEVRSARGYTRHTSAHAYISGWKDQAFLGVIDPLFQSGAVNTTNALRVRVLFENMLLKLLKKQRIVVIILEKRLTFVHGILPGRVKYLCRSLLRGPRNSQLLADAIEKPLLHFFRMALGALVAVRAATSAPGLGTAVSHHHGLSHFRAAHRRELFPYRLLLLRRKFLNETGTIEENSRKIDKDQSLAFLAPSPYLLPERSEERIALTSS